jgi:hypothetical protein
MSTLYKTKCRNCEEQSEVVWGDGMFHIQYQCVGCLKLFNIPRKAPRQNRNGREVPKFLETQSFKTIPPTASDEITRFTIEELKKYFENSFEWQKGDDEWDDFEIQQIISIESCNCRVPLTRVSTMKEMNSTCQKCGSSKLEKKSVGILD